jgi:N-acetylglucosaminyldiphosphoundecaprenol N-acetyl-beta-D-mannosaminyltransferase
MTISRLNANEVSYADSCVILGLRFNPMTLAAAADRLLQYAVSGTPGYVCLGGATNVMEARRDARYREAVNGSLMTTTDGTPARWMAQLLGSATVETVDGPRLTPKVLELCAESGVSVGFYGSSQETLDSMLLHIRTSYPDIQIGYCFSPPFRPPTREEDEEIVRAIVTSGAQILFVGLGCPKQERWMAEHSPRLPCLLVGVGAVFDFLAGNRKMAPPIIQQAGLTWLFRFVQEPRRLLKRILHDLPCFMTLALAQLLAEKLPRYRSRIEKDIPR